MMRSVRRKIKWRYLRKGLIYFLTWCLLLNTSLPTALADVVPGMIEGENVVHGTAGFNTAGDITTITTGGASTIIEYSRFNIDSLKTVDFAQPDASSAVLNRIVEANPSLINGALTSNGRVFIVNPAGIVFGEGSTVNVAQLVASSLGISNDNFIAGNYEFIAGDGIGEVVNNGTITAAEGAALIGRKVRNAGTITAGPGGFVVMAAGDRVLLGEPGSNIIVEMDSVTPSDPENPDGLGEVVNDSTGKITARGGTIVLAAGDMFSTALRVESGVGRVVQSGNINANGIADGGNITLTAADEVRLTSGSLTTANAATGSDAGLVVVHSKDRTAVEANAQIQAIGGHVPHDLSGDFDDVVETTVEISGDYVNFAGTVNASATGGKRGKVVIDALDMTVAKGSKPASPPDNTVYETWIEAQSNVSTDVELVAHSKTAGNITVARMNDGEITGGSGDIVLRTKYNTGGITFLTDGSPTPTAIRTTGGGNIYMLAGEGGITAGNIITDLPSSDKVTEPGKIRLLTTNNGDISTGRLSVTGGSYDEISVIASGDLTINGAVQTSTNQVPSDTTEVGQARTCLVSEHGNVVINGAVTVEAHGKNTTTADIHIDAGQNITMNLGGGQIKATAKTSQSGPANATVLIHAGKDIEGPGVVSINNGLGSGTIYVEAKAGGGAGSTTLSADGQSNVDLDTTVGSAHVEIEVDNDRAGECPDCPTPPGLIPPLDPWGFKMHMGNTWSDDVLSDSSLKVFAHTEPLHGTLIIDYETGEYQYTPDAGYVGQDSFTYQAIHKVSGTKTDWATVTITVTNELPVANPGSAGAHMSNSITNQPLDYSDVADELGITDQDLTITIVTEPLHGTVTVQWDEATETWTYTYVPDEDESGYFVGTDSFEYTVTDAQGVVGASGTAQILVTINNTPPVAVEDTVAATQGETIIIDVLANDFDLDNPDSQDVLTVVQDSITVQYGTLVLNEDGTFTYTPDPSYTGPDVFTYAVTDGESGAELIWVTVTIMVTGQQTAPLYMPAAPGLEPVAIEVSGCPALVKWAAAELGTDERMIQVWMASALASARDIQPCNTCADLKAAATILQDEGGTRLAALADVINEFASSDAPPTEEQMASIADAMANDIEGNIQYAAARDYLDALAAYVGILNMEIGFSTADSMQLATDNYVAPLAEGENVGVAAYVAARLTALGG
ncbi:MAG: Ig-like domain-containing protein [Planctomycetota bacterium]